MNDGSLMQYMLPVAVGTNGFIADFSDWATGNPATDIVNMEAWDEALFFVIRGAGAVGTQTITVEDRKSVV